MLRSHLSSITYCISVNIVGLLANLINVTCCCQWEFRIGILGLLVETPADSWQKAHNQISCKWDLWPSSTRRKPKLQTNHLWTEIGTSSQGWLLQGRAQLITNHDFPQGLVAVLAPGLQATSRIRPHSHSSASQHATPWHRPQQRPSFTLYSQALLYGRLRVYKDAKQPVNWGLCFFSVFHKHISDLAFPHH